MNRQFLFPFVIIMVMMISCTQVYNEWDRESFSTLSWKPEREIKFYPEIEDTTQTYELTLGIRFLYGSRLERVNLMVTGISPTGKQKIENYTLILTDKNGKSLANCAGNMCDLESVVNSNLRFTETGTYTFAVRPAPGSARIIGIMEFGFILGFGD
jgi:gliding motility-associated lipoprotein GldH